MLREIITINEEKCTGCGDCIPNCPEGAIQIIDNKARLVSELMCDGLGACLGHCPEGAIALELREAEPYDEYKVIPRIVSQGENTLRAHLAHLRDHGQTEFYRQALTYLREHGIPIPAAAGATPVSGCPGSRSQVFAHARSEDRAEADRSKSALTHWPIQMHLISPDAPQYQRAHMLLAADCVAYAMGDFHSNYLSGKALAIACPKLDARQEVYVDKLAALIDQAAIQSLTVMMMQVPCCRGLLHLAQQAATRSNRHIPVNSIIVSLQGEVLESTCFE